MGLFGSISKALFGKKNPGKSESGNQYAGDIKDAFLPSAQQFGTGFGRAASILGGGPEGNQAVSDWFGNSGGKFLLEEGLGDVNDRFHSLGLGRSGAAMKAMEGYRSGLASTKLNEYLGNLMGLNQQALGAGGLVTQAGQYSKGTGEHKSGGGLGKLLGLGLSLFSDPRLKTNIVKVGEEPDGLGVYDFDYLPIEGHIAAFLPEGRQRGVMADEVARLRPWALGPEIGGYATVRYDLLGAAL